MLISTLASLKDSPLALEVGIAMGQVSYGRNGKLSTGANSGGKKASAMGSMGKVSSDTRFGGGPPKNGGDVSGKGVGNRRETVKPYVEKNGRKVGNYVKESNNNLEGSRFAVLSEEVLEGPTGKNGLHIPKKHPLVPVTVVLAEISNKIGNRMKLVPSTANKYLVTANTDKSHHYVSSKENRGGGITSECTIGSNKVIRFDETGYICRASVFLDSIDFYVSRYQSIRLPRRSMKSGSSSGYHIDDNKREMQALWASVTALEKKVDGIAESLQQLAVSFTMPNETLIPKRN
ncbi:hypothetical protein LWI29_022012 [Acer saccharum]|uniref:Uncharacterized protein n=1 Tax=Acer saccharum TaxID=4024 RepID=A0AA39T5L4_ACESA|nr:hypothetical protein LWI29_022012 [Acer saccharum]